MKHRSNVQIGSSLHHDPVAEGVKNVTMFDKLIAWFRPTKAEREEALHLAQHARNIEHGHSHEHADGIVHTHDHGHGDYDHDHDHGT